MAAAAFTKAEWRKIRTELNKDPRKYGLPQRKYGSVVVASFNIRKLGKLQAVSGEGRDDTTMQFLADVCRRFDLIAVQEVMADMSGVRRLKELLGDEYGLVVSDIVGAFPGERGNEERLAYLYNRRLVQRSALVTEVTASRTKVIKAIALHHEKLFETMDKSAAAKRLRTYHNETLPAFHKKQAAGGKKKKAPREPAFSVNVDNFLQFIRTPFGVSFEVRGHPGLERYPFVAVNAHLHYGRVRDRRAEARTLVEWILGKVRSGEAQNVVLLGDLNFNFKKPTSDLKRILKEFDELGGFSGARGKRVHVSFPFIFPHPSKQDVFRTNVRHNQTFDQIGVFSRDSRLAQRLETTPQGHAADHAWGHPDGPDYGVFDFADLFACALNKGTVLDKLPQGKRNALLARFEHKVSDHMPIWLRMPLPHTEGGFPTNA